MSRQPFFPLFLGDLLAATATWNGEQRALYAMLLAYQWFNGPIPSDPTEIALMVGYRQDRFDELWQRVRTKYVEQDGGLVNLRCEDHRRKARQLSQTRAALGRRGAASRWEDDSKQSSGSDDKGNGKVDSKPDDKGSSKSMALSHPIPSHPDPSEKGEEGEQGERTHEDSQSTSQITEPERHAWFERCKAAYPQFAGKQDWINAERAASTLVANSEITWAQLEAACSRYAAYCQATGDTGTQYVMRPGKFFTDVNRPWLQEWKIPEPRTKPVEGPGAAAMREFLKQGSR